MIDSERRPSDHRVRISHDACVLDRRPEVYVGAGDETVTVDVVDAVIAAARGSGLTVGDVVALRFPSAR